MVSDGDSNADMRTFHREKVRMWWLEGNSTFFPKNWAPKQIFYHQLHPQFSCLSMTLFVSPCLSLSRCGVGEEVIHSVYVFEYSCMWQRPATDAVLRNHPPCFIEIGTLLATFLLLERDQDHCNWWKTGSSWRLAISAGEWQRAWQQAVWFWHLVK